MKKTITTIAILIATITGNAQNCSLWIDNWADASCPSSCDGSADAMAAIMSGDVPLSVTWQPGNMTGWSQVGLCGGTTYTLTLVTKKGCTDVIQHTVAPNAFSISMSKVDPSCGSCPNGSATANVSGGTPGYNYSWSPSGQVGKTATGLTAGVYTVYVTDANSCAATPQTVTLGTTTSLNESAMVSNLKVYPNPASSQVTVELQNNNTTPVSIVLTNVLGEEVYTEAVAAGAFRSTINTASLPAGIYFMNVRTAGGTLVEKIVKY